MSSIWLGAFSSAARVVTLIRFAYQEGTTLSRSLRRHDAHARKPDSPFPPDIPPQAEGGPSIGSFRRGKRIGGHSRILLA